MARISEIGAKQAAHGIMPPPGLPVVIQGTEREADLPRWIREQSAYLTRVLELHGAILLRGFGSISPASFGAIAEAFSQSGELMGYRENTSPRTAVLGNIKTSTDYRADKRILLHNEHSYSRIFPQHLYFACATAPAKGGGTLLADCRRVLERIEPGIVERFERMGWMYVRNFRGSFGPTWQSVFETRCERELAQYCVEADIDLEWNRDRQLTIRHVRAATMRHPRTGHRAWFNHVAFWNIASLQRSIRDAIVSELSTKDYPNHTYYGDGSPIEPEVIERLLTAYDEETVGVSWQAGDVMVLDNIVIAHGREAFEPPRLIWFAMSDPVDRRRCAPATPALDSKTEGIRA